MIWVQKSVRLLLSFAKLNAVVYVHDPLFSLAVQNSCHHLSQGQLLKYSNARFDLAGLTSPRFFAKRSVPSELVFDIAFAWRTESPSFLCRLYPTNLTQPAVVLFPVPHLRDVTTDFAQPRSFFRTDAGSRHDTTQLPIPLASPQAT